MPWHAIGEFTAGLLKGPFLWISNAIQDGSTIASLGQRKDWKPADVNLLFIDDEKVSYIDGLKKEGFVKTKHWEDIDSRKYTMAKLFSENFDIIFLDILGVGERFLQDGAIGILRNIKDYNPSIIVILYSSASYKIDKIADFNLADDHLSKDANIGDVIERITSYMNERYSLNFYWNKIVDVCTDARLDKDKVLKLEKALVRDIRKQKNQGYVMQEFTTIAGAHLTPLHLQKIQHLMDDIYRRFL